MKKRLFVFYFAILSLTSLMAQNVIEKEVKEAVRGLSLVLLNPLKVNIKEIILDETNDMTSEFSYVIYSMVRHHAVENPMFDVIDVTRGPKDPNEPSKGVISGKYSRIGINIRVTLELKADGTVKSSKPFLVPVSAVEEMGISIIPDNFKTTEEAVKQDKNIAVITGTDMPSKNPVAQNIQIEAWFDSQLGNRLYMHGEPLEITVTASQDSYFRIFHIDVDNQYQMIFPASKDDDNRLRANESRTIFNTPATRRVLCGPYGSETLVVVASPVQFPDIEQEYGQPWKPATQESLERVIAGAGEARYTITILKPHTEYEFTKPENMIALYQGIRDDAAKQKGYFNGNEASGFYIIGNVRGSYLVTKPDTIQFASYSLDVYNGNSPKGVSPQAARGQPYIFSFDKPQDINQAIQAVQTGIKNKGGTFTGDERQGSFKASGIAGQYKVSDKVDVTISEKPFVVPNSLIEKEVKNFFGVR